MEDTYGLPIPVTRDGSGKWIKDYCLVDWAGALEEERAEVMEAAVEYRQYLSWNNRKHLWRNWPTSRPSVQAGRRHLVPMRMREQKSNERSMKRTVGWGIWDESGRCCQTR